MGSRAGNRNEANASAAVLLPAPVGCCARQESVTNGISFLRLGSRARGVDHGLDARERDVEVNEPHSLAAPLLPLRYEAGPVGVHPKTVCPCTRLEGARIAIVVAYLCD